jgi:hypothetical protein
MQRPKNNLKQNFAVIAATQSILMTGFVAIVVGICVDSGIPKFHRLNCLT